MPTTVFTEPSGSASQGGANAGFTFRTFMAPSSGGLGQVRCTFYSGSSGNLQVNNAAIAVKGMATAPTVSVAPTELLFSGGSGFTIAASSSIVSDWLTFSFLSTDLLCVITDMATTVQGYSGDILFLFDNA